MNSPEMVRSELLSQMQYELRNALGANLTHEVVRPSLMKVRLEIAPLTVEVPVFVLADPERLGEVEERLLPMVSVRGRLKRCEAGWLVRHMIGMMRREPLRLRSWRSVDDQSIARVQA